ncbi:group III truncated hemoglobin [Sphingobacterium sp. Mn56C]|uniref:group III truncated hemoglobin n=1 Tax=Sphingobacterium sp. Mn56C TaxID=3395261 RepID=UPI003BF522C7
MEKQDIGSMEDIKMLVNTFYDRIRKQEILGPIFDRHIEGRWPEHLEKMYRFWQTLLLGDNTYDGRPFPPHAKLPIGEEHFTIWLALFNTTVDDLFAGDRADEAKWRGQKMAAIFQSKLHFIQQNPDKKMLF